MIRLWATKLSRKMVAPLADRPMSQRKVIHTITGLKRWSCHSRELPRKTRSFVPPISNRCTEFSTAIQRIKALHVYDFDNTRTPAGKSYKWPDSLTFSSLHEPFAKSETMGFLYHWLFTDARVFCQWWLVA